jgi:hypothetical protein
VFGYPLPFRQADEEFGKKAPWDSVIKLEWVHKKAKGTNPRRRMIWMISGINDLVRTKLVAPGELSINGLSGKGRGGGRGMLDLLLFKLDLLDEFMNNQADKCGLPSDAKTIMRPAVESNSAYRTHFGDDVDMTWMLTMPKSAKEFIELVGDRC